jgi:hypothetical protein
MEMRNSKAKSFIYEFTWVGIMLLSMGMLFLGIALVMQLVPLAPENVNLYYNGVRQPSTLETVEETRLLFGLIFGGLGVLLGCVGLIVAARKWIKRGRAERLKAYGTCVQAAVTGNEASAVRINHQYLTRLQCAYTGGDGVTYIFKSDSLRMDPTALLDEGMVTVYYDEYNMKHYFVDVDGSVGVGTKVVEL